MQHLNVEQERIGDDGEVYCFAGSRTWHHAGTVSHRRVFHLEELPIDTMKVCFDGQPDNNRYVPVTFPIRLQTYFSAWGIWSAYVADLPRGAFQDIRDPTGIPRMSLRPDVESFERHVCRGDLNWLLPDTRYLLLGMFEELLRVPDRLTENLLLQPISSGKKTLLVPESDLSRAESYGGEIGFSTNLKDWTIVDWSSAYVPEPLRGIFSPPMIAVDMRMRTGWDEDWGGISGRLTITETRVRSIKPIRVD